MANCLLCEMANLPRCNELDMVTLRLHLWLWNTHPMTFYAAACWYEHFTANFSLLFWLHLAMLTFKLLILKCIYTHIRIYMNIYAHIDIRIST